MLKAVGGGPETRRDKTGEDGRDDGCDIWVDVEALVVEHGGRELHHLLEDEQALEVMGDLFRYELHEVRYQLVQPRITPKTGQSGYAILVVGFVQESTANLFEIKL